MKCCNHDCLEGRQCPHKRVGSDDATQRLIKGAVLVFAGILIGFILSKYSARAAYELGHSVATANLEQEQEIRMAHFDQHRMESCLSWWWKDSYRNLQAAQFYMCQNRERWQ